MFHWNRHFSCCFRASANGYDTTYMCHCPLVILFDNFKQPDVYIPNTMRVWNSFSSRLVYDSNQLRSQKSWCILSGMHTYFNGLFAFFISEYVLIFERSSYFKWLSIQFHFTEYNFFVRKRTIKIIPFHKDWLTANMN